MASISTTSNLGPPIIQQLAPGILYTPTPTMPYHIVADKAVMQSGNGATMRFLRPAALSPPTVQLGNSGIDPPAQIPRRDFIDVTPAHYGTGCLINYQVLLQDQDGVLAWVSERLGVAMKQAEDLILRDYLLSAASRINAAGGSNGDNPTNLSVADFSLVASTLDTNNAMKFMSGISGEDRFGSGPVRSSYFMISSTELQSDFDALTGSGFLSQTNYASSLNALYCEFGNIYNIRILTTSEAPVARNVSANSRDVYYNVVLGKQAVTHVVQSADSMKLIYRDPMYAGMLAQNATLAIRFSQGQGLTQDTAVRILCATRSSNYGGV